MIQDLFVGLLWNLGAKPALLVLLALMSIRLLAGRVAGAELVIWRSVLLSMLLLLPLQWLLPAWHLGMSASNTPETLVAASLVAATEIVVETPPDTGKWMARLGLFGYLSGVLLALGGLLTSLMRLWRWTAQATPMRERLPCGLVARLSRQMQLTRRIRAFWSRRVSGPMSWGLWSPTILLPSGLGRGSGVALEHALAHELAHLRRGDWIWHLSAQAIKVVCWWNPLVRLMVRRHGEQTELACDRLAVQHCDSAHSYARSLLAAAEGIETTLALSMAEKSGLGRRIESLFDLDKRRLEMRPQQKLMLALAMGAILVPLAACSLTQAAEPDQGRVPLADASAPALAPATTIYPDPPGAVAIAPVVMDHHSVPDAPSAPDSQFADSDIRAVVAPVPMIRLAPPIAPIAVTPVTRERAELARVRATERERQVRLEASESRLKANQARVNAHQAEQQVRMVAPETQQQARLAQLKARELQRSAQQGQERQQEVNAALKLELAQMQTELASTREQLQLVQRQLKELKTER